MSKTFTAIFFLGFIALTLGFSLPGDEIDKALNKIKFDKSRWRIEYHYQIYPLEKDLQKDATTDEQKECLKNRKDEAIEYTEEVLGETLGKVYGEVMDLKELVENNEKEEALKYLKDHDYMEALKNAKKQFTTKMNEYITKYQEDMQKCLS